MSTAKQSFSPLITANSDTLILGTLPGEDSLKYRQYYGHSRNAFWRLIGDIIGYNLTDLSYQEKCAAILQQRLALWDTLASARRQGSLDSRIRTPIINDIPALLRAYPRINRIAFNGKKARQFFKPHETALPRPIKQYDLPSSSPAYTLTYEKKLAAWRAVLAH